MILLDKKGKLFAVNGTIPIGEGEEIKEIEYLELNEKGDLPCDIMLAGDVGVGISSLILKSEKKIFQEFNKYSPWRTEIKTNNIIISANIHKNFIYSSEAFHTQNFEITNSYRCFSIFY